MSTLVVQLYVQQFLRLIDLFLLNFNRFTMIVGDFLQRCDEATTDSWVMESVVEHRYEGIIFI